MKSKFLSAQKTETIVLILVLGLAFLPTAGRTAAVCGDLDSGFSSGSGANDVVRASVRQSDGKIVIGGAFTTYNGSTRYYMARLTTSGGLDSYSAAVNGSVIDMAMDASTERVVAVGAFSQAAFVYTVYGVAKFLTNGNFDTSFSCPSINVYPYAVAVDSGGKILIGGAFTSVGGYSRTSIARLLSNGSLDLSFELNSINGTVYAIKPLSDGKVLIGGTFTTVSGQSRGRIARLNSNGSLDTSYPIGAQSGANNTVYALELDESSHVLVGGEFTQFNGTSCSYLARLETDGIMPSVTTTAPNGMVRVIRVVPSASNDFLIGGDFTSVGSTSSGRFARFDGSTLAAECTLGSGFGSGTGGAPTSVNTICVVPAAQNKAFCGGNFTTYKGSYPIYNRLAQIYIE